MILENFDVKGSIEIISLLEIYKLIGTNRLYAFNAHNILMKSNIVKDIILATQRDQKHISGVEVEDKHDLMGSFWLIWRT